MHPTLPLASPPRRTPRLALVLGSGGVRSAAALGIADVLAREGVRPDLVAGCSSGALFGATVALGLSCEMALRLATTLWSSDLTDQRRWRGYAQLVAPRWAGFDADFSLRSEHLIAERLRTAFGTTRLEDLRTPLRVAATDAATGEGVLLTRGALAPALQASMAVPFLFPSVELDGRRYVDGVVSDPLPVAAAADASVVIALVLRGAMPRRVDRASRLLAQVSTSLINNLQDARLAAARAAGQRVVTLHLELPRPVGLWDTSALRAMVESGRHAALACWPQIERALVEPRTDRRAA